MTFLYPVILNTALDSIPDLRKIIHIDMDAFYASVEQRDSASYRGKPLAVGGSKERGVVAAASYEARKFGVRSAMSSAQAYRLCPQIIFVKPRFDVYRNVSQEIRQIFHEYTDLVEPVSLDEAYLDVTVDKQNLKSATVIAQKIKQQIQKETSLTASAGVSFNKFLAKIASDYHKPNGIKVILPEEAPQFLEQLPIEKFHGIGKVTAKKMHQFGIYTGADLKKQSLSFLNFHFGKSGYIYFQIVRGIDERPVNANRIRKSIGTERTFSFDLYSDSQLATKIEEIAEELVVRIQKYQITGSTLTLKVKYADFTLFTKRITTAHLLKNEEEIKNVAINLLNMIDVQHKSIRLLGLTLSNLHHKNTPKTGMQLSFDFDGFID